MTTARHLGRAFALLAVCAAMLIAQEPQPARAPQARTIQHRPGVPGVHGLVAAGHPLAAMAGIQILMKGGNAVDAAVAVAAVLNVVEPQMSGLGGNGFMTIFERKTGKVYSLGMTGAAPRAVAPDAMTADTLNAGIKAALVPGNVGGYLSALERFGTMGVGELLTPAIAYAEGGYPIDESLAAVIERSQKLLERFPTSAAVFLPGGRAPRAGSLMNMPGLARTLRQLVDAERQALTRGENRTGAIRAGFDRFYKGDIAAGIDRFFKENGGLLSAVDLAAYAPTWTEPLHTTYRGYDVYSSPPTSRGGVELLMQLNLVEPHDLKALGPEDPRALHLIIEAIKVSKADVYRYIADPNFTRIPMAGLLSKEYAAKRRALIDPLKAMAYPHAGTPAEVSPSTEGRRPARVAMSAGRPLPERFEGERDTTSFSIVDRFGNAVACTPTLGGMFGTGVVIGDTGLLFNNGMRLGATSPYPDNVNYVRGGQIPLLNNAPTIVLRDGRVVLAFGTPGGETIGQTQFQMLVNVVDFGMAIQPAIEAPRFALEALVNFYKPGSEVTITMESRVPLDTVRALEAMGHHIRLAAPFTSAVGGMQGILVDPATGTMKAGADPRRTGYAIGY